MKLVKSLQKTLKPFTKMVKKSNKLMLLLGVLLLLGLVLLVKMYMKKREGFNETQVTIYGEKTDNQDKKLWVGNPNIPLDFIPSGKIAFGYPSTGSGSIHSAFRGKGIIYKYPGTDKGNLYVCVFKESWIKFAYFKIEEDGKYTWVGRKYFMFDGDTPDTRKGQESTEVDKNLEFLFWKDFITKEDNIINRPSHPHYPILWPSDGKIDKDTHNYQLAYIEVIDHYVALKNIHFTHNLYADYYESGNTSSSASSADQVKSALKWCKNKDHIQYPTSNSSIDERYASKNTFVTVGFVKFNGSDGEEVIKLDLKSNDEGHLFIIPEDSKEVYEEKTVNVYDTSISPPIDDKQIEAMVDTADNTNRRGKYHIINDGGYHAMRTYENPNRRSYTFNSGKIYKIIVYSGNSADDNGAGFKLSVHKDHINKFSDASSFIDGTLIKKLYRDETFNGRINRLYEKGGAEICLVDKIKTVNYAGNSSFTEVFMGYMKLKNSYNAPTKIRFALKGNDNIFLYIIPEDNVIYNNIFIGEDSDDIKDINILHKSINYTTTKPIFRLEYIYTINNDGTNNLWKSGDYELDPGKKYKIIIYFENIGGDPEIHFLAGKDNKFEVNESNSSQIKNPNGIIQEDPSVSNVYKELTDIKNTDFPLEFISINKGRNLKISQNIVKTKLKDGLGIEFTETNTVNNVVGKAKTKYEGLQTVLKNQGFMYRPAPSPTPSPSPTPN